MTIVHVRLRDRQRHASRPPRWFNALMLLLLRSPLLHRALDPGLCELRYRGRRSGYRRTLPVMYAQDGTRIVVLIGDADDKQWWRNFTRPAPIEVRLGGRMRTGTARVLRPGQPGFAEAAAAYRSRHGVTAESRDRVLTIE